MGLIKNVGDYKIYLREGNGHKFNSKNFYISTFIIIVILGIICNYGGIDIGIYVFAIMLIIPFSVS